MGRRADFSAGLDGLLVASAGKGKVIFTWNSTLVSNGPHSIEIVGFPKQRPANSAANISVKVQNQQSSGSLPPPAYFATLPASSRSLPRVPAHRRLGLKPR